MKFLLAMALAGLANSQVMAHSLDFGTIAIFHPAIQASAGGAKRACATMKIANRSDRTITLLGASAPIAEHIRLIRVPKPRHSAVEIARVDILPGETMSLRHKDLFLQFEGLKQPLYGGTAQGLLYFADRPPLDIDFVIESRE